ncbi:hypothetical protein [Microbacterium sp.]|uniref:hypothetical protein n=1 Tax=Microbacterium sp. TaxID=51671 RepID=UPI003A88D977
MIVQGAEDYAVGCGIGDLPAIADVRVGAGGRPSASGSEYDTGTIVRFVLQNDRIEVWVSSPAAPP